MSSEMIDSMVLILGADKPPAKLTDEQRVDRDAARNLLTRLKVIRVSALTLLEYARGMKSALPSDIMAKLLVEPVTAPVALLAAELMKRKLGEEKVCKACFNADEAKPCKTCRRHIGRVQAQNDGLIVATACSLKDVSTLYTLDRGVLAFAPFVLEKRRDRPLSIQRPVAFSALPPPSFTPAPRVAGAEMQRSLFEVVTTPAPPTPKK